jgi:dipeptide transport system substrate-binding protein
MKIPFLFAACLAIIFTSCNKGGDKTNSANNTDTFVYCSEGSPSAFNPQIATDGATFNAASKTLYDRLVAFKYGETALEPGLAERWEVSPDGLSVTFFLRKGVKFHQTEFFTPTRDFNADDVLFSFNRQRLKDHPFHPVSGGNYEYFNSMDMGTIIKDIVKVDDYQVVFKLGQKDAPFLANMGMDFTAILSQEYANQLMAQGKAEQIDQQPIGTGPFILKSYAKDTMIRYESHEQYYDGAPAIKKMVFAITPDASVRYQKLKAGECHFINEPAPADLAAMKTDNQLQVMSQEGLNVGYLAMNTEKAPFNNKLVRKAINHALNRPSYIEAIYLGNAVVAKNPIPPTMWSYEKNQVDYDFNIETAKKLLAEAGFPNGFKTQLWTLPVSRPYNPNGKKMGEMMQADLAKVGIDVTLVTFDWPTYLAKSRKGEHDLIQLGWTGDNGDPDNFLNVLLGCTAVTSGSNVSRWCDQAFNDLIDQAKQLSDFAVRTSLYEQAQRVFKDEAPWVTLAHSVVHKAMSAKVQGYKINPFGQDIFTKVTLSK